MDADKATKKISESLKGVALWFDDSKIKVVEARFAALRETEPDRRLSEAEITAMIRGIPSLRDQVVSRAADIIRDVLGANHEAVAKRLTSRLASDAALKRLLQ
ncbi:hypothetical protein EOW77_0028200 [Bradyrhizobium yuanmingense]|nr:hypothetical protein EOW77_0028200 [Bradyrhizobium yuanmingense]